MDKSVNKLFVLYAYVCMYVCMYVYFFLLKLFLEGRFGQSVAGSVSSVVLHPVAR